MWEVSAQVLNEYIIQVLHKIIILFHQWRVHFYSHLSFWPTPLLDRPTTYDSHPFLGSVQILCDKDGDWVRATESVSYHYKKSMPVRRCATATKSVLTITTNQCTTIVQRPEPQSACRSPLTHCQWQWLRVSQLLSTGPITFFISNCHTILSKHIKTPR